MEKNCALTRVIAFCLCLSTVAAGQNRVTGECCIEASSKSGRGDHCDFPEIVVAAVTNECIQGQNAPKARPVLIHLLNREPHPMNITEPQPLLMLSHKFQKRTTRYINGRVLTGTSA